MSSQAWPRRHLYRLTPEGLAAATAALDKAPSATSAAEHARLRQRLSERMSP